MKSNTRVLAAVSGLAAAAPAFAQCVPQWDVSIGSPGMPGGVINAFATFNDGGGVALYASGVFATAGGVTCNSVAKWTGTGWQALASGLQFNTGLARITSIAAYDDGTGTALYAGGNHNNSGGVPQNRLSKWNGSTWTQVGAGVNNQAFTMVVFDTDGPGPGRPELYLGGAFTDAGGVAGTVSIAKWNGVNFSTVGGGMVGGTVNNMIVADLGTGPSIIAGGRFTMAGTTPATLIARWDGAAWHAIGDGLDGGMTRVNTLAVYRGNLYAAGNFTNSGPVPVQNIAFWDGSTWNAMPGLDNTATASAVFDDGGGFGERLFVGGAFANAGGNPVGGIAAWDGTSWDNLSGGLSGGTVVTCSAMRVFDDGTTGGEAVYAGGGFLNAGGSSTANVARWTGCDYCYADCDTSTGVGNLDIFDFLCFQNRYDSGSPYACDCDLSTGPGTCDIFDFLCFQNAFDQGCP